MYVVIFTSACLGVRNRKNQLLFVYAYIRNTRFRSYTNTMRLLYTKNHDPSSSKQS